MPELPDPSKETEALDEEEMRQLQQLLDRLPEPLQPLDISALDGFLCGVLLQPNDIDLSMWLPCITDLEARPVPAGFDIRPLQAMVLRRFRQLQRAITAREWFDPWIFELDAQASVAECVLPWVAGFAAATDRFPQLMQRDDPHLLEPLALIYRHFEPEDLEDAQALQQVIETIEPPENLGEAVQDLVRSVMLLADITRPRRVARAPRRPGRRR